MNKMFLIIKNDSERVKKKNFRPLCGMPLHEYFMKRRKNWEIYIDTDSDDILSFYRHKERWPNVIAYRRLPEHIEMEASGDISPAPLMIKRFLNTYVSDDDEPVVTSHITSPFIDDITIVEALSKMRNYDSVSSVLAIKEFAVDGVGTNVKPINFSLTKVVKTQSLNPIGVLNGAFFILRKSIFLMNGLRRISDKHYYFPVAPMEALDIDTEYDFKIAELLAKDIK